MDGAGQLQRSCRIVNRLDTGRHSLPFAVTGRHWLSLAQNHQERNIITDRTPSLQPNPSKPIMNPSKRLHSALLFAAFTFAASFSLAGCGSSGDGSGAGRSSGDLQPISIIKYSDYQCPACKVMIPMEKQLLAEYGDLITFEYRHFPLGGHQFAALAAQAVEAARLQGDVDGMHDLIFERQELWARGNADALFEAYAAELGLDVERFKADVVSQPVIDAVESQRREGARRLVPGTPTYFINGRKITQNPRTYEQFKALAELYMADAN
jgi:predicted DsbA family dithiol-disulfide isomerase